MPNLAELELPPRPRGPDQLRAALIAAPLVALCAYFGLPFLHAVVLGGAADLDARMARTDAYVQQVCGTAMQFPRDEKLCGCVLAADYPALDCQHQIRPWMLARQSEQCAAEAVRKDALTYCTCIDTVHERVRAAGAAVDPVDENADEEALSAYRAAAQALDRCEALADRVELPTLDQLRVPRTDSGAAAQTSR